MAEIITIHATFGKAALKEIAITQLHSGLYQPWDVFAQETLESLSKTIEQLGVLEPLIVRVSPKNRNQYEIVAGERRYRAAKLAGLTVVPCLLANYSNEGEIEKTGFHFLGIEYPPTQIEDNTNVTPVLPREEKEIVSQPDHYLREGG